MFDLLIVLLILVPLFGFYKIIVILEKRENRIKAESLTKFYEDIERKTK